MDAPACATRRAFFWFSDFAGWTVVALAAVVWGALASAAAMGADDAPGRAATAKPAVQAVLRAPLAVLRVPACGEWMHLAVAPREKPADGAAVRLVEEGDAGRSLVGQWMPAAADDGTASAKALLLSVPPARAGAAARRLRVEGPAASKAEPAVAVRIGGSPPSPAAVASGFAWHPLDKARLALFENNRPVLTYNFDTITNAKVPAKDPRRTRSGYVHPIYGINGETLTDDFPSDHAHHHGLFWSWPHVAIDGKQYDLWVNEGIQQRFVKFLGREAGPAGAVIGVEAGWFVGPRKAVVERTWLTIWPATENQRAIDVRLVLIPVERPLTLQGAEGKSYGGLNLRYAPREKTVITVPKGRTRDDLPDTPLEWADLSAQFRGAPTRSGAAVFVPATHADFPPTWLTRHYGILCVGWPGVRARTFPADRPIVMDYRVWIHKHDVSVEQLARAYAAYNLGAKAAWE